MREEKSKPRTQSAQAQCEVAAVVLELPPGFSLNYTVELGFGLALSPQG